MSCRLGRALGLALVLSTASAAAQDEAPGEGVTVIVNVQGGEGGRDLQNELAAARQRLARLEEEATSPDHGLAALFVAGKSSLTSLVRVGWRAVDAAHGGRAEIAVYVLGQDGRTELAFQLQPSDVQPPAETGENEP